MKKRADEVRVGDTVIGKHYTITVSHTKKFEDKTVGIKGPDPVLSRQYIGGRFHQAKLIEIR